MDPGGDVVVCEDVWGSPFDVLAGELTLVRDPELWADRPRLLKQLHTAKALVVRNRTTVDAELLAAAPRLRVVARAGVGLDNIDVAAASERGVLVVAPLGANAVSVAEHTIGLALALLRDVVSHDRAVRAGRWERRAGRELREKTWGVLGAGATGLAVARLARAFGMSVLGYDPYVAPKAGDLAAAGVRLDSLDRVCANSDVLSIHLPATPETTGMIGHRTLALMRPDAIVINVGRGEVVDEVALADALESGRLAGAALDVRGVEPPALGRLEHLDQVVLTPHVAGITAESQERILSILAAEVRAVLSRERPHYAVNEPSKAPA